MPRIAIGGFHHETNTFAPSTAGFDEFVAPDAWPGLSCENLIIENFQSINIGISGFISTAKDAAWSLVPLIWASAGPSGPVTEDAFERIAGILLDGLRAALPLDGVYLCLHGAMVCAHIQDGEGELLARVRSLIGDIPLVASLDLHANVTQAMLDNTDALVAYRTYPHLDMAETGVRAARLMQARLVRGTPFVKAFHKLDFLIPLTWQCTLLEPGASIYRRLGELENDAIASLSFTPGFPPADIRECGPAIFAYGDDRNTVETVVQTLASDVENRKDGFAGRLWSAQEAVAHAIERARSAKRPVILADTQDNPGGGANSDTVWILAELVKQKAEGAVVGLLYDPPAAQAAHRAGQGAELDISLGAGSGLPGHAPFETRVTVVSLSDGAFTASGPFYDGSRMQLGPMAVLEIGGVRVVVTSRKQQAADQAMFTHLGIELARQGILVLKSSVHFRADFQSLADEVLVVAAPGPNVADPAELAYRNLRPGMLLGPNGPAFEQESDARA
ncbi:MAG: M81 family metallopeptidase [Alphaproteobacteria bacterium]|nr:M81 family metallopeptidase [Alphaproteobacteria bacterium]